MRGMYSGHNAPESAIEDVQPIPPPYPRFCGHDRIQGTSLQDEKYDALRSHAPLDVTLTPNAGCSLGLQEVTTCPFGLSLRRRGDWVTVLRRKDIREGNTVAFESRQSLDYSLSCISRISRPPECALQSPHLYLSRLRFTSFMSDKVSASVIFSYQRATRPLSVDRD